MANYTLWSRLKMASRAFKEVYTDPSLMDSESTEFSDGDARLTRYELFWGYYLSNIYRQEVHKFAKQYMARYGLYKFTRELYNPAFIIGSFYRRYVWGGGLDIMAGDGKAIKSALPIITDHEGIRPAIGQIWTDSNWRVNRLRVPLLGSVLGDVFIRVVDDADRQKVYLEPLNPNHVYSVTRDPFGNVKEYDIRYQRNDDTNEARKVEYRETATRDGENVVFNLYKDKKPYAWGNEAAEWREPYGFVPLVHFQHIDIGLGYGVSELNFNLPLFREVDDQGSKLNDQIRKTIDPVILLSGARDPGELTRATSPEDLRRPEVDRTTSNLIWTQAPNVSVQPLLAQLDIGNTVNNIRMMLEQLEHNYPELSLYRIRERGGELSGRAVRLLQREAAGKVLEYRDTYDDGLVRAQKMALSIGAMKSYPGYQELPADAYARGLLDHHVGERPVFASDPIDQEEILSAQLANQERAMAVGWPIGMIMKMQGYDDEKIVEVEESEGHRALLERPDMDEMPDFGE